ncbi:MAG TPA: carbohydrate binding domain-containing protein [Acetivibrio sp.]|uniref:carbohydrate binding domain-containing protein n=1 Tax=Acetivibrio sp. TaxID=1872092 RepID=UPI002C624E50|nr:carbohydrate binding domain-containing protein [Acetivibrio sp.]HOM03394.1 carbohydrate binding domain-containing protein [Acetivibrio sp.]
MLKKVAACIVFVLLFGIMSCQWAFAGENLLQNPSFEDISDNKPTGWETWAWDYKEDVVLFGVGQEGSHDGQYHVTIENKEARDARYLQQVSVKPNACYKFSAWVKTENVGQDVLGATLSLEGATSYSRDIKGTVSEWQYTELYIRTGQDASTIKVSLGLGGYGNLNTGKAMFDSVALEEVDSIPEGAQYADVGNSDNGSNASSGGDQKSTSEDTQGKYTVIWFIISLIVLVMIAYYYYREKNQKSRNTNEDKETTSKDTTDNATTSEESTDNGATDNEKEQ